MTHAEAVKSLSESLDPTEWCIFPEPRLATNRDCIPDVLAIKKSYANYEVRIYEVKVSDADLNSDLRSNKFEKYFNIAHKVFFALGPNVSAKAEESLKNHSVGIVRFKTIWRTKKPAPKLNTKLDVLTPFDYLALLMNGKQVDRFRRTTNLEAAKDKLLKLEIHDLYMSAYPKLKELARELKDERYKLEKLKELTIDSAKQDILHKLQIYSNKEDWIHEVIRDSLREARETFDTSLRARFKESFEKLK